jgi:succinate dehydrogenase/fumarate reductase flavoprotein subunit
MSTSLDPVVCDLLILGCGMAGLTAAALAAETGARVVAIEKASEIGGSAALSGGYVWTCTSPGHMAFNDDGDRRLQAMVLDEFPHVMAWLRRRCIDIQAPQRVLFGRGYQIDILGHLAACARTVEKAGGHVIRATETLKLISRSDRVAGALTRHADGDIEVRAKAVLLATGGYQASPDLRANLIHPAARDMILRSNPASVGDGLRLGCAAGGSHAGPNPGFYGHLLAYPVAASTSSDFVNFTQYHSDHSVLLNRTGQRYLDESRADHTSTQMTLRQPEARALLVWDQRVQDEIALRPPVAGAAPIDRFALARAAGANTASAPDIAALAAVAATWGYDGERCAATLQTYNAAMALSPEAIAPARIDNAAPLVRTPYYLMEVQPSITFTYGGLSVNAEARVLDPAGQPVPGLYAAGADMGNVYRSGYAGGLALAATSAFRAMRTLGFVT